MAEIFGILGFAVAAGIATFFSPCAYALLPGYVGFYLSSVDPDAGSPLLGALARGMAAVVGVGAVFGVLTLAVVLVGRALQPALHALELVVGGGLILLGAALATGRTAGWHTRLPTRRASLSGFVGFGAAYAVASAGCVAPLFFALVLRTLTLSPGDALVVLGSYVGSFSLLLLGATTAIAAGHSLGAAAVSRYVDRAVRAGGVILLVAGGIQLAQTLG
ncbi:cytochrome c biogenesis CcdA family protein (plasmid) [Haloferacaceae archaeon DSL9]